MVGLPYDDLESWRSVYPPDTFIRQMEKVADGFRKGLKILSGIDSDTSDPRQKANLAQELRIAEVCAIHFQSVANQCIFIQNRDSLAAAENCTAAASIIARLKKTIQAEMELAIRLRFLQLEDSRFGFEASNHYFYVPQDLAEKVLNCNFLLEKWLPAQELRFKKDSVAESLNSGIGGGSR